MIRKIIITIFFFVLLVGCTTEQGTGPEINNNLVPEKAHSRNQIDSTKIGHIRDRTTESPDNNGQLISPINDLNNELLPPKNAEVMPEPPIKKEITKPKQVEVKGIYLNRTSITDKNVQKYIDLIKNSNLNAAVIDLKDDYGKLTYDSNIELANQIGADSNPATKDLKALVQRFKDAGIYTIARIVVFKDPYLATNKSEYAMKRKNGNVWQDASGTKWIDPYKDEVWNYITSIAKEASDNGFDEIQYDYIRFPERAKKVDQEVQYDNPKGLSKSENIVTFLKYSENQLKDYPIYVSADVFGLVTTASDDMGIGQVWEQISSSVDYISPMTYPSHYAPGSYGVPNPDRAPYEIMRQAMIDAKVRNGKMKENGDDVAIIRPWIQDFDYKSTYSADDVRKQIEALEEQGITQYLLWNAGNTYTMEVFH